MVELTVDDDWVDSSIGKSEQALFTFDVVAGAQYFVSTRLEDGAGKLKDSVLFVNDGNLNKVAQNDNIGRGTRASSIGFKAPSTGNYIAKVRSYNPTMGGDFRVRVSTTQEIVRRSCLR